ncbi:MAG: 16S rRNA (cytosine(967)-C(5))-methyltransferase, partial [Lachnospiraceae bacterium]|nr:16S rRNA (cytosine(967)-C(5))-methyltransferase [Lachnospiraceae bacterium]
MAEQVNTRLLALEYLLEVTEQGTMAHRALGGMLECYQYLEKRERAFLTRLCEGTLERLIELDWIIDQVSKLPVRKQKPVIRCILRLSVYQLKYMDQVPDAAVCSEAVRLARMKGFSGLSGFVNGVLRNIARRKPEPAQDMLSIRYSTPEWIVEQWTCEYGRE